MKLGLAIIVALVAGAVLSTWFSEDPGRVLVVFRGYTVQMSVPILVASVILLYVLVRLLVRLVRAPRKLGETAARMRARRASKHFTQGLIELAEGNWSRGERLLTRGVRQSDTPLLNYLSAARAAQLQGAHERRDNWLRMAFEQTPSAATAVLLTQAELQLAHQQYEQALATLRKLEENAPNHVQSLSLLARIYEELGDWDHLLELLPKLQRYKALAPESLAKLEARVYRELLGRSAENKDAATLRTLWSGAPKAARANPEVLRKYVQSALICGAHEEADKAIFKSLKHRWDEDLVYLYGAVETDDAGRQLSRVENWLKDHGDDARLLLTAGRLSMRVELWGKARSYLESSLAIRPLPESYQLYGQLLEQLGESDNASDAYRSGLALAAEHTSSLPALESPAQAKQNTAGSADPS